MRAVSTATHTSSAGNVYALPKPVWRPRPAMLSGGPRCRSPRRSLLREEPPCHDPYQHEDMTDPLAQGQVAADRLAAHTAELTGEHPKVEHRRSSRHALLLASRGRPVTVVERASYGATCPPEAHITHWYWCYGTPSSSRGKGFGSGPQAPCESDSGSPHACGRGSNLSTLYDGK